MNRGSCLCGTVQFEAGPFDAMMHCNCSMCRRKGSLLHFVPATEAKIDASAGKLGDYRFNKRAIHHHFCADCGCSPFATGTGPGGSGMVAVNMRCVAECDLEKLEITQVDGASF